MEEEDEEESPVPEKKKKGKKTPSEKYSDGSSSGSDFRAMDIGALRKQNDEDEKKPKKGKQVKSDSDDGYEDDFA